MRFVRSTAPASSLAPSGEGTSAQHLRARDAVHAARERLSSVGRTVSLAALTALAACAGNPTSNEVPANGDAPRVEALAISHAGGRELRQRVIVDSATQHFTVARCDDAPIAVPCTTLRVVSEGTTPSDVLASLFESTNTSAFRSLANSYAAPTGVVAPDGGSTRLEVVRNGSRRVITWANNAYLPEALVTVNCILLAAQLNKNLCD